MKFYYKIGDSYRIYDITTKQYKTVEELTHKKTANFYVFDGYNSDEGLKKDHHASTINHICKFNCPRLDEFEDIDPIEFNWIEKCYNGGLQILRSTEKQECFGYDFKACYLSIL
eukprot:gene18554-26213_t